MTTPVTEQIKTKPEPFLKGIFSLFDTPDGGLLIAYRPDGAETDEHVPIPAVVAQVLRGMQAGKMPSLREMMKIMKSVGE